jgi:hypothetical protein
MLLVGHEGQQRYMPRPLDGLRQLTLVLGAGSGHPAGKYLARSEHHAPQLYDNLYSLQC